MLLPRILKPYLKRLKMRKWPTTPSTTMTRTISKSKWTKRGRERVRREEGKGSQDSRCQPFRNSHREILKRMRMKTLIKLSSSRIAPAVWVGHELDTRRIRKIRKCFAK